MTTQYKIRENPLYSPLIPFTPMVKTCVLYTSYKLYLFLKFIEVDEAQAPKFSKVSRNFNFTFDVSVHAIVMLIVSYISPYKKRFVAFHLSRVDTVLC